MVHDMSILATVLPLNVDAWLPWVVLYVGPDLILPLTSALAAIVGVLLMFWHRVTGLLGSVWNMVFQRNSKPRG